MTIFTTNSDINACGRQMFKVRPAAEAGVRQMIDLLFNGLTLRVPNPENELAKIARREVARRRVDTLLR